MKPSSPAHSLRQSLPTLILISGALLFGFSGCATRGYEKAAATSDAAATAANQVERAQKQIDATTGALRALTTQPAAELPGAFETFRTSVSDLEQTFAQLKDQTDAMEKQGRDYFTIWDERLSQIRNEDIRARSADRQREVTEQFTGISRRYQEVRRQLEPLINNLRDIRAALGVDLTPAGLQSTRPFIDQTDGHAVAARQALTQLGNDLRVLNSTLNPAVTAPSSTS